MASRGRPRVSSVQGPRSTRQGDRWRVVWREPGQRKLNVVGGFTTEEGAAGWKALLDLVGGDRARAALDQPEAPSSTRTVAEQVETHIAHLTGVTTGTRKRYRDLARRRINDDPLGRVPLTMASR